MPRAPKKTAEFANFIFHAGEDELLDWAVEIVIPALLNETSKRTYGETRYFLHDCSYGMVEISGKSEPAVVGRFVKDTVIRANQVFKDDQLVPDGTVMASAPNAIFLLILRTHKLVYCKVTPRAPSISEFRGTVQSLMRERRNAVLSAKLAPYKRKRGEEQQMIRDSIEAKHPIPELEIVLLANLDSITDFVSRFRTLNTVKFKLIDPNHELDFDDFVKDLRKGADAIGAENASVVYNNPKGLDTEVAQQQIADASNGNVDIKLKGIGKDGNKLDGNSEALKVVVDMPNLPSAPEDAAQPLAKALDDEIKSGKLGIADSDSLKRSDPRFINLIKQLFT